MIEFDERKLLPALRKEPTLAARTYRAVALSVGLMAAYNVCYTFYEHANAGDIRRTLDAAVTVADSALARLGAAVQSQRAALDSLTRRTTYLDSLTRAEPRPVSDAPVAVALPVRNPCGTHQQTSRAGYDAEYDSCTLVVTIPRGGSISGASLAYFGDMYRWQDDAGIPANAAIKRFDRVEPGETYTFSLRAP